MCRKAHIFLLTLLVEMNASNNRNPESLESTALYLIPVNISDAPLDRVLPPYNSELVKKIRYFIVENIRTARRFLRRMDPEFDIDNTTFFELNGHTDSRDISGFLTPLREGHPMGLMSEAGCPAVADPGAAVVEIAQREKLKVAPLVGPSSILMSLMASGFNGQGFAFHGYIPVDEASRIKAIKNLELESVKKSMTQIFIETPYRNNKLVDLLSKTLRPDTMLCVASDITDINNESIISRAASVWKKSKYDYSKRPAIFLIYRPN